MNHLEKILWILFSLLLVSLLTACGKEEPLVTEKMNGGLLTLVQGQSFILKLHGNPTTGYVWQISSLSPVYLKPVSEVNYQADSLLTGSGGTYTYEFTAVKAGTTTLELVYRRPWEENKSPYGTFQISIRIGVNNEAIKQSALH